MDEFCSLATFSFWFSFVTTKNNQFLWHRICLDSDGMHWSIWRRNQTFCFWKNTDGLQLRFTVTTEKFRSYLCNRYWPTNQIPSQSEAREIIRPAKLSDPSDAEWYLFCRSRAALQKTLKRIQSEQPPPDPAPWCNTEGSYPESPLSTIIIISACS